MQKKNHFSRKCQTSGDFRSRFDISSEKIRDAQNWCEKTEVRDYKYFVAEHFFGDVSRTPCYAIKHLNNLNYCWRVWKRLLNQKH